MLTSTTEVLYEALEALQEMKTKKAILCCTSDQCKNATQHHESIGHRIEGGIDFGFGWYRCLTCGKLKQDVRCVSGRMPPIDPNTPLN